MTQDQPKRRRSLSQAQRVEARDRTDEVARGTIEEERRRREAKTRRLRAARMQAQEAKMARRPRLETAPCREARLSRFRRDET